MSSFSAEFASDGATSDAAVKEATEMGLRRGREDPHASDKGSSPAMAILFSTSLSPPGGDFPSVYTPEDAMTAASQVLGMGVAINGGGVSFGVFFCREAGAGYSIQRSGVVGALCWPTMGTCSTFTHGLEPVRGPNEKLITSAITETNGSHTLVSLDHQPAWEPMMGYLMEGETEMVKSMATPDGEVDGMYLFQVVTDACVSTSATGPWDIPIRAMGYPNSDAILERLGSASDEALDGSHFTVQFPLKINVQSGEIDTMNRIKADKPLVALVGSKNAVAHTTSRLARDMMHEHGIEADMLRGAFMLTCATNYILGGEAGMQLLARELADAVGWCPLLGIIGGPEFGVCGDTGESRAQCMATTIVAFSNRVATKES